MSLGNFPKQFIKDVEGNFKRTQQRLSNKPENSIRHFRLQPIHLSIWKSSIVVTVSLRRFGFYYFICFWLLYERGGFDGYWYILKRRWKLGGLPPTARLTTR